MARRNNPPNKTHGDKVLGNVWDAEVYSLGAIDETHVMIHKGLSFHVGQYWADIDSPSGVKYALFPTGSDYRCHITFKSKINGQPTRVTLYETGAGHILTGTGSQITPINRKRTSSYTAQTLVWENPTVFRSGFKLVDDYIAAGVKSSDEINHSDEWYLAPNKIYFVSVVPDADNASGTIHLDFYEEQE